MLANRLSVNLLLIVPVCFVLDGGHLAVQVPALGYIFARLFHQFFGAGFVGLEQHAVAGLIVRIFLDRNDRILGVDGQRVLAFGCQERVVAVQRPDARV